jgi:hypothetical protein
LNNDAKPALFAPSSFDVCFGINQGQEKTKDSVMCSVHGVGSGTSSIGLNPSTCFVHSAPPNIIDLPNTATNAGLQKSMQHEWGHVQHVTEGISKLFQPLEKKQQHPFRQHCLENGAWWTLTKDLWRLSQ